MEFGQNQTDSFENMRYIDGFYLPMVEVVKYLYDSGFIINADANGLYKAEDVMGRFDETIGAYDSLVEEYEAEDAA